MTNSAEFVEKEIIMQAFHMSKSWRKKKKARGNMTYQRKYEILHMLSKNIEEIKNQTCGDKIYNM